MNEKVLTSGYVTFPNLPHLGAVPFRDSDTAMEIEVTQKDIDTAICADPANCVLAKALKRTFGGMFQYVLVGKSVFHVLVNGVSIRFGINGKLRKAIRDYDKSKDETGKGTWNLEVGKYILSVPSKTARRGGRPNRRKLYGGKGGTQQRLSTIGHTCSRTISKKPTKAELATIGK